MSDSEFKLIDLSCKIDGFVPAKLCKMFMAYFDHHSWKAEHETSDNAATGELETSPFKSVEINPDDIEYNLAIETILKCKDAWCDYLQQYNMVNAKEMRLMAGRVFRMRILRYQIGDFIHPHTDVGIFGDNALLRASCTINLNSQDEDYKGGEFKLLNDRYTVPMKSGDTLVFPVGCEWVHRVTPVEDGVRYSLSAFLGPIDPSQVS